ncbi:MAG: thiamine phosphate synthase [Pyrinomonadaceae bacterium]
MNIDLPKIYPITDAGISGMSHAEQIERLSEGGATLIQFREKFATSRDTFDAAVLADETARKYGVRLIINDRVDIALALNSQGVHLGQDDLPPAAARRLLGEAAVIGLSTHSATQVLAALSQPIDYIAIGPIFPTATKQNPDAVVGLDELRHIRKIAGDFPLVAIGGINSGNLSSVFEAGADSAALIGAILSDPSEIAKRMRQFAGN